MVFNLLSWASGSIPISFVKPGEVDLTTGDKLKNQSDFPDAYPGALYKSKFDDIWKKHAQECLDQSAIGLPLGVQFACFGKNAEERILRFMHEIEAQKKLVNGDESKIHPWDIN